MPVAPLYPLGVYPDLEPFFESLRHDMQLRRATQRIPYAATITPDANKGEMVIVDTLTGDLAINNPVNSRDGMRLYFSFTQDGTGGRTVTFGSDFSTAWGTVESAGATSTVDFRYDGGTGKWVQESNMIASSSASLPSIITDLITFDRDPNPPFGVTADSGVVTSLDSDLLDGQHGAFYRDASNLDAGTLLNNRVAEANVTQHEAALTILETQITDGSILARVGANETITGTFAFNPAAGAPFTTTRTDLVTNLNADRLDSQHGAFYRDADNLNAGTVPSARLSGAYSGITGVGTIATGVWSGTTISSVTQGAVTAHVAAINHDLLLNFASNEHFLQSAITVVGTIATGVWQGSSISTTYTAAKLTSVTGGTGIDVSASTGAVTFTLDVNELAVGGTLVGADHLIAANAAVSNRQLISSIPLGIFSNDQNWTSNTGDITGVNITAGTGLSGSVNTGSGQHTQTLSVNASQTQITALGTIATGIWQATQVANGFIADLPASKTTSGTFVDARIPNLNASKITAGTFVDARIPNLNTSKITAGTFANARISSGNVTQHQGSINHDALSNFLTSEHFTQGAITTVGTITSGTWSATTIAVNRGGTGLATWTSVGRLIVSTSATAVTTLDSGAAGGYVRSNGTTWVRSTISASDVPSLDTSKITTGTFANARIAVGNVTQHQGSINHDALSNFLTSEHFTQGAITIAASQTTSGTFVDARIPNLNTSKITAGTFANARISSGNITQHQGSINHDALSNFTTAEHFTQAAITTVGVLNSGSITSGFGSINIGSSQLTVGNITGVDLVRGSTTGFLALAGGSNSGAGALIKLYGQSAGGGLAHDMSFQASASIRMYWDNSALKFTVFGQITMDDGGLGTDVAGVFISTSPPVAQDYVDGTIWCEV